MNNVRQRHMYGHPRHRGGDKRWFGFALLMIGVFILLKRFVDFDFHNLWPWVLVGIGLVMGVKNRFRNVAPFILIAIGLAHAIPVFMIWGVSSKTLIVPLALIVSGLLFIFRPQGKKKHWGEKCDSNIVTVTNDESMLNIDVTFGGHKEIVTSKNFKGGKIVTNFGGTEVNLMNADSAEKIVNIHMKVSFGGVELIVPSHWEVKNELSSTVGSVEDNRMVAAYGGQNSDAVTLVLTGSCNFGSIEVKSY